MRGEHVIFYTTEQGGIMKVSWADDPPSRFAELVEKGTIQQHSNLDPLPPETRLAMVALAKVEKLHDFRVPVSA